MSEFCGEVVANGETINAKGSLWRRAAKGALIRTLQLLNSDLLILFFWRIKVKSPPLTTSIFKFSGTPHLIMHVGENWS